MAVKYKQMKKSWNALGLILLVHIYAPNNPSSLIDSKLFSILVLGLSSPFIRISVTIWSVGIYSSAILLFLNVCMRAMVQGCSDKLNES